MALALAGVPIARAADPPRVIGVLSPFPPLTPEELKGAWEPLRKFGWVEGRHFTVERGYAAGDLQLLRKFAQDIVRRKPLLILSVGTEATLAAAEATTTVPIVMMMVGDPIGVGLVRSLGRPGGNVTGYSLAFPEMQAKRASLLRELIPSAKSVGILFNPRNPLVSHSRASIDASLLALGMEPAYAEVTAPDQVPTAIEQLAARRIQALMLLPDPMLYANAPSVIEAARARSIPVIANGREVVEAGAVISYDSVIDDQIERVTAIVDRVLRGARPADIPVEQPRSFELIVNVGAARRLGLPVPQSLLLRADEVLDRP